MSDEVFENSDSDAVTYKYSGQPQELLFNITLSPSETGNQISTPLYSAKGVSEKRHSAVSRVLITRIPARWPCQPACQATQLRHPGQLYVLKCSSEMHYTVFVSSRSAREQPKARGLFS
jgi:hypothetical protein